MLGIEALINRIRGHRRKRRLHDDGVKTYGSVGQQESWDVPLLTTDPESFVLHAITSGLHTSAELNEQGNVMGWSAAAIGSAVSNLIQAGRIESVGPGVYLVVEHGGATQTAEVQPALPLELEVEKQRKKTSNALGIWSLVLGIVGLFLWPAGIAAIVLGALQFKRHVSKCAIAGFTLGIVDMVLFLVGLVLVPFLGYYTPLSPPV